jgi:uncharacterized protein YqjF (DUF2071 family)
MASLIETRQSFKSRPTDRAVVMYQRWEELLFLHWRIEPSVIQATLPKGLFVDTFEGEAWMGVVPFFMCGVRPRFCPPVPHLSYFQELNVRTYVHDENGTPGVWFYSLDANRHIAVWVAQRFFHLPYLFSKMSAKETDFVDYTSERGGTAQASRFVYRGIGDFASPPPDSLESFLVDRYLLFSYNAKNKILNSGRVWHDPYRIRAAEVPTWDDVPLQLDGFPSFQRPPDHICSAENLSVLIYPIQKV